MKAGTFLIAAMALTMGTGGVEAGALAIGDKMPATDVEMQNVDGRMLTLGGIAGEKGTLVIFSCNHCPFVQAWQARMVAIGNDGQAKGVGVVLVNANDPVAFPADDLEHMKTQAETAGYKFPYLVDATSDVARAFGADRTPDVFLFDAERRLVYRGAVDDNTYKPEEVKQHYLRDAVAALLAGQPVPTPETRSVGCSIKFREK